MSVRNPTALPLRVMQVLSVWLLAVAAIGLQARADFRPISDFHHTAWTSEQGAPAGMYALAQTPDGWLWLGGPNGLFRFDGVQFEPVTFADRGGDQSTAVSFLFAEDAGDLWIGWIYGGVSHYVNGSARHYGAADGMPDASVTALGRDAQGVVWAATVRGLLRFDGGRWQPVGPDSGFADAGASSFLLDGGGTFWIAGFESLYRIRKGEQRVERTILKSDGNVDFMRSLDGRAWYSDAAGVYPLPDQIPGQRRTAHANARVTKVSLFDSEGYLWTLDDAVTRHPAPTDAGKILIKDSTGPRFTAKDGLSSNRIHSMLEDMEGNIWIVTAAGVDRFRPTNVRKVVGQGHAPESFAPASIAAADDGAVWIGINHGTLGGALPLDGLWKFTERLTQIAPKVIQEVTAVDRDANGALWIGGSQGVWRQELSGQFRKLPDLPAEARGRQVRAITVDGAGSPWVSVAQASMYRLRNETWEINGHITELPSATPNVLARDPIGRTWFGYRDGRVAIVQADDVRWYGKEEGLNIGMIRAIHVGGSTVVAGDSAVAVLHEGSFHTLQTAEEPSTLEGVAGIVEAHDGDLWVNGVRGAVRIPAADLREALRNKRYTVAPEIFDAQDGFPGMSPRVWPLPTLIRGSDDRLWFTGTLGIGWLDPQHVRRNSTVPPVHIRSVISDGTTYAYASELRLPEGAQNLQVNYTALSLSRPERVRFRYRLDGYDQTWVDAGPRRNAFYTNLPPGEYRFRVIAANDSGVWNDAGASLPITIPPTFTQTRIFLALCALAGVAVLWAAYALRIRQVTARERSRLEERLSERERIARELHDTLLQGVQGLILKLQAAVDGSDMREQSRQDMNEALDRADALLMEGRDRVKDLRSANATPTGLRHQLVEAVEAAELLSGKRRAKLRVVENGTPRDLHPIVREEVVRIASEAMFNAVRHAEAGTIEVEVSYERLSLRINVRDDGRGMEEAVIKAGRDGHFGFLGMQERAKRIRGQISIWSRPGAGTEVSLTVPASMAYVRRRWSWSRRAMSLAPSRPE